MNTNKKQTTILPILGSKLKPQRKKKKKKKAYLNSLINKTSNYLCRKHMF